MPPTARFRCLGAAAPIAHVTSIFCAHSVGGRCPLGRLGRSRLGFGGPDCYRSEGPALRCTAPRGLGHSAGRVASRARRSSSTPCSPRSRPPHRCRARRRRARTHTQRGCPMSSAKLRSFQCSHAMPQWSLLCLGICHHGTAFRASYWKVQCIGASLVGVPLLASALAVRLALCSSRMAVWAALAAWIMHGS